MAASFLEARKKMYKRGLDVEATSLARRERTKERRKDILGAIFAENRRQKPQQSTVGLHYDTELGVSASEFEAWKVVLWSDCGPEVELVCRKVQAHVASICEGHVKIPENTALQHLLMQVCYYAYRLLPGSAIIPVLDFFVQALKCSTPEIVRFACLTINAAMARDHVPGGAMPDGTMLDSEESAAASCLDAYSVTEMVWKHAADPLGIIMETLPRQRDDIQHLMLLTIILALEAHSVSRLSRILPFFACIFRERRDTTLFLVAFDSISEVTYTATLEELHQLRECGMLAFYIEMVAEAKEERASCIETALEMLGAYAAHEASEPTAWLLAGGGLQALELLAEASWLEEETIVSMCIIVSNVVLTAVDPVLSRTSLCQWFVECIQDVGEEEDEDEEMECLSDDAKSAALSVIVNATLFAGVIDSVRCQALYEIGAFGAFLAAVTTFGTVRPVHKDQSLAAILIILDASPELANEFADCKGVDVLMQVFVSDFGKTAGDIAKRILLQHFPRVLSEKAV